MLKKIIILFFFLSSSLFAKEEYFMTLRNEKVNLRQGPSFEYPIKIFYTKKFLPVLIQDKLGNFRKIRDHENKALICPSMINERSSCRPWLADRTVRARPLLEVKVITSSRKIQNRVARICGTAKVSVRCFESASRTDSRNIASNIMPMP